MFSLLLVLSLFSQEVNCKYELYDTTAEKVGNSIKTVLYGDFASKRHNIEQDSLVMYVSIVETPKLSMVIKKDDDNGYLCWYKTEERKINLIDFVKKCLCDEENNIILDVNRWYKYKPANTYAR